MTRVPDEYIPQGSIRRHAPHKVSATPIPREIHDVASTFANFM
ncbi:MAG TPA: hypothetical protein VF848_08960 [Steroidobacteraceae bacterium]